MTAKIRVKELVGGLIRVEKSTGPWIDFTEDEYAELVRVVGGIEPPMKKERKYKVVGHKSVPQFCAPPIEVEVVMRCKP